VTLTPAIGNCVAGAGGIAAAVASKAIAEQRLPARLHAGSPPKGVCAGASESAGTRIRTAVVCSSSVGGQNASIVMREGD
jgi:3-oxoacyl-(acyl-carrier-protein) synthase